MVVRGREAETRRFQDLFNTESIFIIQGLPGIGKRTFLQQLVKTIPSSYELETIQVEGLFQDIIKLKNLGTDLLPNNRLTILLDLDKAADFTYASAWIASQKNENKSKWIIVTKRGLDLPRLERLDLCTFTLSGLSVEDSRRWVTDLYKKHTLMLNGNFELQTIIDLSGGHPWFLKFLIAHISKVDAKNWLQLRGEPEFVNFANSLEEHLSGKEKDALTETASFLHGFPTNDLQKTSITGPVLKKLEDLFLIENGQRIKLASPFLQQLYSPNLTRRRAYRLFRYYKSTCALPEPSLEDLHGLGKLALQLGKVDLGKDILTSMIPRIRTARHSQWALELFDGLEEAKEPLTPELQLAQVDLLNLVARYSEGHQKVSKLERNISEDIDSSTKMHMRRAMMWALIMDGQYKKAVDEILLFLKKGDSNSLMEYVNNLNHLAFNYVFLGKFQEAKAAAEESLALQATIPEGVSCYSNSFLVLSFDTCGEYAKALSLAERFLENAVRNNDRLYQALLYRFMGKILTEIGQYSKAEDLIQQAYATFIENENPFARYSILSLELRISGQQGKYKHVKLLNEKCAPYMSLFPNQFSNLVAKYHQAIVEADQGNLEAARDILNSVKELATKTDCKPIYGRVLAKLADIDLTQCLYHEAHKKIELAKSISKEMGDPLLEQINLGLEAKSLTIQQDYLKAISLFEKSERIASSLETPYGRALALNRLAGLHLKLENIEKANQLLEQSSIIHRQLGDRRGEVDDLFIKTKMAMKERKWQKAHESESLRNGIIKEEEYTHILPGSNLTLAIIALQQENPSLTQSICQSIAESHRSKWEELAALKILKMTPREESSFNQITQRIEQLEAHLTTADRKNIENFFSDLQIEQPRDFLVQTNSCTKQVTHEALSQFSQKDFDLWINFATNEFHEKTLGNLYFGHETILHTLFETLVKSPGRFFTKEELYRVAWQVDYHPLAHDPKIYFMINRLRKLIEPSTAYRYILSSDLGYTFNEHSNFCLIQRTKPQTSTYLNPRQRTLLSILNAEEYISNIEYRKRFQISNATAYRDLKELTDRGLLFKEGDGRGVKYRQREV